MNLLIHWFPWITNYWPSVQFVAFFTKLIKNRKVISDSVSAPIISIAEANSIATKTTSTNVTSKEDARSSGVMTNSLSDNNSDLSDTSSHATYISDVQVESADTEFNSYLITKKRSKSKHDDNSTSSNYQHRSGVLESTKSDNTSEVPVIASLDTNQPDDKKSLKKKSYLYSGKDKLTAIPLESLDNVNDVLGNLLSNKLNCLTIEAPLQEETVDNLHLPSSVVQSNTTKNKLYVDIDNAEYMKAIEPYISKGNAEPLKALIKFDYVSDKFTKKT